MSSWIKTADDDGNEYYYNTVTGETAWELPEGATLAGKTDAWEAVQDGEGNTYYVNNVTGESSWDPPPGFGAAVSTDAAGIAFGVMLVPPSHDSGQT
jgi:hypothetical protein